MNPCRIWNNYRYYLFYLKKHICFKGACLCLDVCITLSICALFGHRMNANIELIIDLEEVLTDFLHSAITSRLGHIECRSRNAFSASGDFEWEKAAPPSLSIPLSPLMRRRPKQSQKTTTPNGELKQTLIERRTPLLLRDKSESF